MNELSRNVDAFLLKWSQELLSTLRIVSAFMLMQHGGQKLFDFPIVQGSDIGAFSLLWMAGILEFFGGILLLVGKFTRQVAFVLSGLMAFAYFIAHAPRGFWTLGNGGEAAVLYCFVFLYMAAAGGGAWSLDNFYRRSGT